MKAVREAFRSFRRKSSEVRRVWVIARPRHLLWVAALFMVLLRVVMQVAMPIYARGAVDGSSNDGIPDTLPVVVGVLAVLGALIAAVRFLYRYGAAVQNVQIARRMTSQLFSRVARAPLEKVNGRPPSYWQNRIQGDVRELAPLYPHNLVLRLSGALTAVMFAGFLVTISWRLALCMLVVAPIGIVVPVIIRRRLREVREVRMEVSTATSVWLADVIGVLPLVKLAGGEHREVEELDRRLEVGVRESMRAERIRVVGTLVGGAARWLVPIVVYSFGGWLIFRGSLTVGDLVAFTMFAMMMQRNVHSATQAAASIDDGLVAFERLSAVLDLDDEAEGGLPACREGGRIREIVFDNVSFAYPPSPEPEKSRRRRHRKAYPVQGVEESERVEVLSGVTLRIRVGEPAILVGQSGSGKSTLMKLLCGLYAPDSGRILVDGVDLREIDARSYRQQLSQISHEGYLLGRDFFENTLYRVGRVPDDPELAELVSHLRLDGVSSRELRERGRRRRNKLHGVPELLPDDLSSPGVLQVSAGERQRVSIVRELLHDAHVWGLDEATSNLDGELEDRVLDRVMAREGVILLGVSHRYSCIRRFPLIHVLDEGRIVDSGTHAELDGRCLAYQRLVRPQMRKMSPMKVPGVA